MILFGIQYANFDFLILFLSKITWKVENIPWCGTPDLKGALRLGVSFSISLANIAPNLCSNFQKFSKSAADNEIKEAERLDKILQPVHHSLFVESNPSPVKYAAKLLGLCDDSVRLPLVGVKDSTKEIIKKALHFAKLI